MTNPVLETIKDRRTILRFETTSIEDEKIQTILEAGRWAPSWLNRQPWSFILIKDQNVKEQLSEVVPTVFNHGIKEAPICIVVAVDTIKDPYHFIEDGSAATQNIVLATHSLGLGSAWVGVFSLKDEKKSSENKIKEIVGIPKTHKVISLIPIGISKYSKKSNRKPLSQLIYKNKIR